MKLSIFLGGARSRNWLELYNSIPNATTLPKEEYELVIVSPYDLPPELEKEPNVRLIKDWGNPTRCYQLGALHSKGEYVAWIADDGIFCPTLSIDKGFEILPPNNGIVVFKYLEGTRESDNRIQRTDKHWRLGSHPTLRDLKPVPNHYLLIMIGLMKREYLVELGGWDCNFEQPGMACVDSSIRWQNIRAEAVLGEMCLNLGFMTGRGTDPWGVSHGPVHDSHTQHDWPLFERTYKKSSGGGKIDFNNWEQAPAVWPRRFPGGKK